MLLHITIFLGGDIPAFKIFVAFSINPLLSLNKQPAEEGLVLVKRQAYDTERTVEEDVKPSVVTRPICLIFGFKVIVVVLLILFMQEICSCEGKLSHILCEAQFNAAQIIERAINMPDCEI